MVYRSMLQKGRKLVRVIRKRKYGGRYVKKAKVPLSTRKYIKRIINTKAELKHAAPLVRNNVAIRGYGLWGGPSQLTCEDLNTVFTIPQGTADGQRLGDKIRVKSMNVRGYVNLDSSKADDATFKKNPMYVKMFIGRRCDTLLDPNTITGGFSRFLASGPVSSAPQNLPSDMYRYVNKELYQIMATRVFKIGSSAPSNVPNDSAQWNNDFKFSKNFSVSLSKHINTVKYTDGGIIPTNTAFYMWFLVCFANGSTPDPLTNNTPLECHYDVNLTYYDE